MMLLPCQKKMALRCRILGIVCIIIIFSVFLYCGCVAQQAQPGWQLNTTFQLNQSNFQTLRQSAWPLDQYPGALLFLFMSGPSYDVSTYLCFLAFPAANSSSSNLHDIASFSFSLAIYMYTSSIVYRGAILWTSNPPITPSSSLSLSLLADGNLVLLNDHHPTPVWSSNTSNLNVSSMYLSLNPVSLILSSPNQSIVWQTANFPTNTLTMTQFLLPAHKLTSWTSPIDPSPGPYSLVMEPGGLALYASLPQPQPYWIWGYYGFNDTFSVMHTCETTPLGAFMDPEGALQISTWNYPPGSASYTPPDNSSHWPPFCSLHPDLSTSGTLPFRQYTTAVGVALSNATFLRLESDGNLRAYSLGSVWSTQLDLLANDPCLLPSYCGPYGICILPSQCSCPVNESLFTPLNSSAPSLGCSLANGLTCPDNSTGKSSVTVTQQIMQPLYGIDYFANDYTPAVNISTQQACADVCFQNCSCLAAFWHVETQACHHVGQIRSLRGALNQSNYLAFLKVQSVPQHGGQASNLITIKIVAGVISGVIVLFVLLFAILFLTYRKFSADSDTDEEENSLMEPISGLPTRFSYKDLKWATNNFERQLGKGGFGAVYAGMLSDGTKVAVKQLEGVRQGEKEFRSEVVIMGAINHNNLLRLLGFCATKKRRLLVYEYMENGSLDQWLFGERVKKSNLPWESRCNIALGTARGLAYLHQDCQDKIIHLDIKPQNILLDEKFNAKVADFGLSRLVGKDETHVETTMRGTPGYLAPEWLKDGVIDEKCDVYSFGKLLMEIISGRKNVDHSAELREQINFPEWAASQLRRGDSTMLTDAELETEEDIFEMRRMLKIAFLCILEDPILRPSMAQVVEMLQGRVGVDDIQLHKFLSSFTQEEVNDCGSLAVMSSLQISAR